MALGIVSASVSAAIALTLVTSAATPALAEPGTYALDRTTSAVDFTLSVSKFFKFKREGQFTDFTGQLLYDPVDPRSTQVDLTVYTSSVDVNNVEHNQLLKSVDFFDVERFPTMHFTSATTEVRSDGTLSMTGDLTIRGVTQRMTIPMKVKVNPESAGPSTAVLESTFEIDRTEFGLIGSAKAHGINVTIAKKVKIHLAMATSLKH